jgi:hypothetical protein
MCLKSRLIIMKLKKKLLNYCINLVGWIFKNKLLSAMLVVYAGLMLSNISWGIPNPAHPFNYQMDEWHQLQAVRATFKDFSANVPGAAHGTMFYFILSGLYLVPFFLFGVINPFILKSSVDLLQMQERLFEILRLNTLIFGLLSIFFIAKIAKDYLKTSPVVTAILFTVSPLWLAMSNYFKYDIALTFWLILSVLFLLKYGAKPTLKNYLISGIFCSITIATKISALPLLIIYVFSFFWFSRGLKRKFKEIILGLLTLIAVFIPLGIPDLILGKGDYGEFLYSNLVATPNSYGNLLTGFNVWWQYLLLKIFPIDFGYVFFAIYIVGILYWLITITNNFFHKKLSEIKTEVFLLICFLLFAVSLISLGIGANGNRLLVLLPFLALLSATFLQRIKKRFSNHLTALAIVFLVIIIVQLFQSLIIVYVKWIPDVRQTSSQWMQKNLRKDTLIGIENIPIYQMLPDIIVKEFYSKERIHDYQTNFKYQIIDWSSKKLPPIIIIANKELELSFLKESPKKLLIDRLTIEKYKEIIEFKPPEILYLFMGNYLNFSVSGLGPMSTISIFEKE